MNSSLLEDRLAANPGSPLFARLAAAYEQEGRYEEAVTLCAAGLKHFPDYATGHLVLGRCFEALGRNVEALIEYRRALKLVPDSLTISRLLEHIEEREQEAFRSFAEERLKELRGKEPVSVERYMDREHAPASEETGAHQQSERTIVTATLAEIYASQGEFTEAIQVYRRLSAEKPDRSKEFSRRIKELEGLARAKAAEVRT